MEIINQDSLVAPGDLREAPISMTTTEANLTGSWKFFSPRFQEKASPCTRACPLQNAIAEYMHHLNRGEHDRALDMLRRTNPLPAITGRVCPRFCEQQCNRLQLDQEVLIGSIERFLGDYGLDKPFSAPLETRPERAAVVGSGPAGLAAAYFLARAGVQVTVFEKESEPGGLLRWGIPEYRLPKAILRQELENMLSSLTIELKCGQDLAPEEIDGLVAAYQAVFCAPGLGASILPREFAGTEQVRQGLDLLYDLQQGKIPEGRRFAVVGGGNVAVDAARSLRRHGKEVEIIYRRTFAEMPAYPEEKRHLPEEGIPVQEQSLVTEVIPHLDGLRLSCHQAIQSEGVIHPGPFLSEFWADVLVAAVGQKAHLSIEPRDGLYLGGDLLLGPSSVVEAMATGRQGAEAILQQLNPESAVQTDPEPVVVGPEQINLTYVPREDPMLPKEAPVGQRQTGFAEDDPGLTAEEAAQASRHCLSCGTCTACGLCWFFCPDVSIALDSEAEAHSVEIDPEHCKGCGLCAAVCPRGVIQMEED